MLCTRLAGTKQLRGLASDCYRHEKGRQTGEEEIPPPSRLDVYLKGLTPPRGPRPAPITRRGQQHTV